MRLLDISLEGFKGIDAEFDEFAPAMVLFGPNDAGKTNLLEAFELALGSSEPTDLRRRPGRHPEGFVRGDDDFDDVVELTATVVLEGLDVDGSVDHEFLRAALLRAVSWPEDESPEEDRDKAWRLADLPEKMLSSADREDLGRICSVIAGMMLGWAKERCRDWEAVEEDYRSVLGACFVSERFRFTFEGGEWLLPDSLRGDLREARERLARQRDLWAEGIVPFIGPLLDGDMEDNTWYAFLRLGNDVDGNVYSLLNGYATFVRATSTDAWADFAREIEEVIEQHAFYEDVPVLDLSTGETEIERLRLRAEPGPDGWLKREGDSDLVSPRVRDSCAELSAEATRVAPPFVSDRYQIVIRPLLGSERAGFAGRKVQVALRQRVGDRAFDLSLAGSGTQTWAQYSIREAMRRLGQTAAAASEGTPKPTIYVLDEPERHLHPTAQEEVARWIADRARDGAGAIIATHAPPFLELPYESTEYYCVGRDGEGTTRVTRIGDDLLGAIASSAAEMGLSPVHAVQLTRAWIVVEGEHDRQVLRHFYGRELDQARVAVLPLRGVNEALALLQLGHLSTIRKSLHVIFDSVRAEWVTGEAPPPGLPSREEKVIDQLRRLWNDPNVALSVEPFSAPDIICVLPEDAVRRALSEAFRGKAGAFPGWEPIIASYVASGSKVRFKDFAFQQMHLGVTADDFLAEVLARSDRLPLLGSDLHRSIEHVLASS